MPLLICRCCCSDAATRDAAIDYAAAYAAIHSCRHLRLIFLSLLPALRQIFFFFLPPLIITHSHFAPSAADVVTLSPYATPIRHTRFFRRLRRLMPLRRFLLIFFTNTTEYMACCHAADAAMLPLRHFFAACCLLFAMDTPRLLFSPLPLLRDAMPLPFLLPSRHYASFSLLHTYAATAISSIYAYVTPRHALLFDAFFFMLRLLAQ